MALQRQGLSGAPVSQGSQTVNLWDATHSVGDPVACGVIGNATRWFRFRPKFGGQTKLTTTGSEIATVIGVFTNRYNLTWVVCTAAAPGDPTNAVAWFKAVRGVDYLVMVDGVGGARGRVQFNWEEVSEEGGFLTETAWLDGRFYFRRAVVPGAYEVEVSGELGGWQEVLRTNVTSGLLQYHDPQLPNVPARFFRFGPTK